MFKVGDVVRVVSGKNIFFVSMPMKDDKFVGSYGVVTFADRVRQTGEQHSLVRLENGEEMSCFNDTSLVKIRLKIKKFNVKLTCSQYD